MERREFITALGGVAALSVLPNGLARPGTANSALRVGLLGCGSRGIASARNLLHIDGTRIVALADLSKHRIESATAQLDALTASHDYSKLAVKTFTGPLACERLTSCSEVDAVLICSPASIRAQHLQVVIEAGKHVWCESPVAVDVPGAMKVLELASKAADKLTLDVGLEARYSKTFSNLIERVHGGALGTVGCAEVRDYRTPATLPTSNPVRRWRDGRALSGDVLGPTIDLIDICNWTMRAHPVAARGRREYSVGSGSILANQENRVIFYYPNGVHVNVESKSPPIDLENVEVDARFFGTKGMSSMQYRGSCAIYGDEPWWAKSDTAISNVDRPASGVGSETGVTETGVSNMATFVDSILTARPYNQAAIGVEAALTAILARHASQSRDEIEWREVVPAERPV